MERPVAHGFHNVPPGKFCLIQTWGDLSEIIYKGSLDNLATIFVCQGLMRLARKRGYPNTNLVLAANAQDVFFGRYGSKSTENNKHI